MEVDFPPGNSASLDPSHMSNMQSQHLAKEVDSLEAESRNYQLSTIPANKATQAPDVGTTAPAVKLTKAARMKIITQNYVKVKDSVERKAFYKAFADAILMNGIHWTNPPIIGERIVDIYELFMAVDEHGGHGMVTRNNQWADIAHNLGHESTTAGEELWAVYLHYVESGWRLISLNVPTQHAGANSPRLNTLHQSRDQHEIDVENAEPAFRMLRMYSNHALGQVELDRVVLALQSGLLWEVAWALNTLLVYTYNEPLLLTDVPGLQETLMCLWRELLEILPDAPVDELEEDSLAILLSTTEDAQKPVMDKATCLLTILLNLAVFEENHSPLCSDPLFLQLTAKSIDRLGPLNMRCKETALAILSSVAGSVNLKAGGEGILCTLLPWLPHCQCAAVSEDTSLNGEATEEWYLGYLLLETLVRISLPEDNMAAFNDLSADQFVTLVDWLVEQSGRMATQRGELAIMALINLAAISNRQRIIAHSRRLIPMLFCIADPTPASNTSESTQRAMPSLVQRRLSTVLLSYLSECPANHYLFTPYQSRMLALVTNPRQPENLRETLGDTLYNLSW